MELTQLRRTVADVEADRRSLERRLSRLKKEQAAIESDHANARSALELATTVAQMVQESAHAGVSGAACRCLSAVFDEPYSFALRFERSRGKSQAVSVLQLDGEEIDPMNAASGGMVDLTSFALRLACLALTETRRVLIMDEPMGFLHGTEHRQRAAELLLNLASELGFQVIMCTGVREFMVGNVIELTK